MDTLDDPNTSEDINVPVGCDLEWSFQLEPWDGTGTSATFNVGASSFSVTITVTSTADDKITVYSVRLTPAQMVTLGLATVGASAGYNVRWTAGDGAIWALGYGTILVLA